MNIVITLPRILIDRIISGKKSVEVRSKVPTNFNLKTDVVYVAEKGTSKVPLMFSIKEFISFEDKTEAINYIINDAAVSMQFLKNYAKDKKTMCIWVLGRVCLLSESRHMATWLGIKKNPQSFIYNKIDESGFLISRAFWANRVSTLDYHSVYMPDMHYKAIKQWLFDDSALDFSTWCCIKDVPENVRGKAVQ